MLIQKKYVTLCRHCKLHSKKSERSNAENPVKSRHQINNLVTTMKKVIFAVLAAFMVSLSFTSCSSSPEDKMMGCLKDMVSALKDTHIKSADDVKALKEKMESIKKDFEEAQKALEEKMKGMSDEEKKAYEEEAEKKYKEEASKIMEELPKEMERLQKEATEANIDPADLAEVMKGL